MTHLPKVIFVVGPTASGKTDMGIALARTFGGEVISADSRQIYRDMAIGTAKPADVGGIPHHLFDIVNPDEVFTLAEFQERALSLVRDIAARGRVPFVVGGTALYVYALVDHWDIPKVPPQAELRNTLDALPLESLQQMLREKDPDAVAFVDQKNKRRLIRALEVTIAGGTPFSAARRAGEPVIDSLLLGMDVPRETLNARIDARVDAMMAAGLEAEVRRLEAAYGWDAPAMNGIGYRQFRRYTEEKETLADAVARLKHDTRDVAKRQMTWFRRDKRIRWIGTAEDAERAIKEFLHTDSL
ncbi:MAG: tRNA (adenosine(37)-N6)-dimethylallyltransferase MiaA [Candidatus Paceibacterota bacterium]